MNFLYPLKFEPILKDKIWGGTRLKNVLNKANASDTAGESWEISSYNDDISVVSNGSLNGKSLYELIKTFRHDLVGNSVYNEFGNTFPLLVKFIDANDILSLQVHPDDDLAKNQHGQKGKTEMWYVIDAGDDASLIAGFSRQTNAEEFSSLLNNGRIHELLKVEKVNAGDVFFIRAGIVHTIYPGVLVAEIQQTSDLTYRIYDWGRRDIYGKSRTLHSELALKAIDFNFTGETKIRYSPLQNQLVNVVDSLYFTTSILTFDKKIIRDYHSIDSFVIYLCTEGELLINYNSESLRFSKGETLLIPACLKNLTLEPSRTSTILEIYIRL